MGSSPSSPSDHVMLALDAWKVVPVGVKGAAQTVVVLFRNLSIPLDAQQARRQEMNR